MSHPRRPPLRWAGVLILLAFLNACALLPPPLRPQSSASPTPVGVPSPTTPAALAPAPLASPPPSPTAPAISPAEQTAALLAATPRPERNPYRLAERLKLKTGQPIEPLVNAEAPNYRVGDRHTFWVFDQRNKRYFSIAARIALVTPHAYWYIQEDVKLDIEGLKRSAAAFEDRIYPTIRRYFGREWQPGVDQDPRLTILGARIPALGGYYSAADEYPRIVNSYSNEREMVYINTDAAAPGTAAYEATLAHELQHMVHWNARKNDDTWVNEGLAELAARLAGYQAASANAFLSRPETQLTTWPPSDNPSAAAPHYGAAYLFMSYFAPHYGSYEALKELLAQPQPGIDGFNSYLALKGYSQRFDDVFRDWVIANYLNDPSLHQGRYSYRDLDAKVRAIRRINPPFRESATLLQYAARYLELAPAAGDVELVFKGATQVKLLPNEAHSGQKQWWANRGDGMSTALTKEFDLTGVRQATLQFWAWYDIEEDFDYAYVEISTDEGRTWATLPGKYTTSTNPSGNNFGHGYTGKSGGASQLPQWVQERIDLAPYVGQKVLIRFEYITDDAVNAPGFALDDISIPELDYLDTAEGDGGWAAQGFVRGQMVVPQRFFVQAILLGDQTRVEEVPLDAQQSGRMLIQGFGRELKRAVIVISALAPVTTEAAQYELSLLPR